MSQRVNESRQALKFSAEEVTLAVDMLAALEKTIEMVYYLMERDNVDTFVLMLTTAKDANLETLLEAEKRDTDILFEVDKAQSVYVMLCQDTKVDGGYRFAERVIKTIEDNNGKEVYCTQLEVRSTRNPVKMLVFKLLESYLKARRSEKTSEIIYNSLN